MHTNKNIFDLQTPLNNNASRDKLLTLALKKKKVYVLHNTTEKIKTSQESSCGRASGSNSFIEKEMMY